MTERPILFSAPMVRALLAGTKTQTRRAIKPQPKRDWRVEPWNDVDSGPSVLYSRPSCLDGEFSQAVRSPYGCPGDRLWVRETGWERPERTARMMAEGADTWARYYYDADGEDAESLKEWGFKRRPSIFMPRWASRLALEITGVRVEQLHAISEDDVLAEGITHGAYLTKDQRVGAYRDLWRSINGPTSWEDNPWVWVVEFKSRPEERND